MTSKLVKLAGTALILVSGVSFSNAASLENKDSDTQTITVTEDGVRNELAIAAGEVINFCAGGCFITMPNGDRAALSGNESVQIVDGAAIIN
jgi:hypothetical protein